MREKWTECIVDGPDQVLDVVNIVRTQFAGQKFTLAKLFDDFQLLQQIFNLMVRLITKGPEEFQACQAVTNEL